MVLHSKQLAIAFLIVLAFFLLRMCATEPENTAKKNKQYSDYIENAEADTPKDTLKALTAHLATMQSQFKNNQKIINNLSQNYTEIEKTLTQLANFSKNNHSALNQLIARVKKLEQTVSNKSITATVNRALHAIHNNNADLGKVLSFRKKANYITYHDISRRNIAGQNRVLDNDFDYAFEKNKRNEAKTSTASQSTIVIPENFTFLKAKLFTALLGRIPVDGVVDDPFPFTVLVDSEQIAATPNPLVGVKAIIMRGKAKGDITLSCVSGEIISATFVLSDQTVTTLHGTISAPLALIENQYGLPCVPGKLISNAKKIITSRSILAGIKSFLSENRSHSYEYPWQTNLTQSQQKKSKAKNQSNKYLLQQIGLKAANQSINWWNARRGQVFDVIFVQPGAAVALTVNKELRLNIEKTKQLKKIIDYKESKFNSSLD